MLLGLSPFMRKIIKKITDLLLPYSCRHCHQPGYRQLDLCEECYQELPWLHSACQRCALPLPHPSPQCGWCTNQKLYFDYSYIAFDYMEPISQFIKQFKFHHQFSDGALLSRLFFDFLSSQYQNRAWPERVIPMPLHFHRIKERGFNQCIELLRPIQRAEGFCLDVHSCTRIKNTSQQILLSTEKRQHNLRKAFQVEWQTAPPDRVAIFDDVVTTGTTVNELAKCLKKSGVQSVEVWALARTSKEFKH